MPTRYKGKTGQVKVGTAASEVVLPVKSFDFKHHADDLDVTDTGSGGKRDHEAGLEHCEGKFEAEWKATAAPFGATFGGLLKAGQEPSLILKTDATSSESVFTGTVLITDVEVTSPVEGTVKYTCSWKSKPDFVLADENT